MQMPWLFSSTSQQIEPAAQSSIPATGPEGAVHGSPGAPSPEMATHLELFHVLSPAASHGTHFSPILQSCAKTSQVLSWGESKGGVPVVLSEVELELLLWFSLDPLPVVGRFALSVADVDEAEAGRVEAVASVSGDTIDGPQALESQRARARARRGDTGRS